VVVDAAGDFEKLAVFTIHLSYADQKLVGKVGTLVHAIS
jgi:hypothetical protein